MCSVCCGKLTVSHFGGFFISFFRGSPHFNTYNFLRFFFPGTQRQPSVKVWLGLPVFLLSAQQFLHLPEEGADSLKICVVIVPLRLPLHAQEAIVIQDRQIPGHIALIGIHGL